MSLLSADQFSMTMEFSSGYVAAYTITEVLPALQAVEDAGRRGKWAQGFVAYEAAPAFDTALTTRQPLPGLPLVWFVLSDTPFAEEIPPLAKASEDALPAFASDTAPDEWAASIAAVHEAIGLGETYQVNLTRRLRAKWPADRDAFALYERLRTAQRGAKYSAFLDTGRFQILSVSPELFFSLEGDQITTCPMKGTARRGRWLEEDEEIAAALLASEKERAENVMIVDLLRNDLGKIAVPGTVRVPELFSLERYPTALQMTSTITAQRRPGVALTAVFAALFPCGSVTGAPKVRTMQHIARLEKSGRGVYCGAVGTVKPGGDAIFNVAIRTLVLDKERNVAEYGVGGGIVWDSEAKKEWAETETKAAILTASPIPDFDLIETLRLENGVYFFRERHLSRLAHSAAYFTRPCDYDRIKTALNALAASHPTNFWRVRLLLAPSGTPHTEITPIDFAFSPTPNTVHNGAVATKRPTPSLLPVACCLSPVSRHDIFLCHKTTHRAIYDAHRRAAPDAFDVLLWNEEGEITEFTIGNLVAEIGDALWTPPRASGLLKGVLREELLTQGVLRERILTCADVRAASRLWLINSVRGWTPVRLT